MPDVTFTPEKLERLERAYEKALAEGSESFIFEGHELLVAYARYLIEHLRRVFGVARKGRWN